MYYRTYRDRLNFSGAYAVEKIRNSSIIPSGRYINYKLGT